MVDNAQNKINKRFTKHAAFIIEELCRENKDIRSSRNLILLDRESKDIPSSRNLILLDRESKDIRSSRNLILLDARSAFDVVEQSHLMERLYRIGIADKDWSLINAFHRASVSSFKLKGDRLAVGQGVRQGVLSMDTKSV